jgi:WD40 repeat protein
MEQGLPVHRVPGAKRSGIFAYTQELDAWLANTPGLEDNEPDQLGVSTDEEAVAAESGLGSFHGNEDLHLHPSASTAASRTRLIAFFSGLAVGILLLALFLFFYSRYKQSSGFVSNQRSLSIQQLNFWRGTVQAARFRPNGEDVVYGATGDDSKSLQLYETSLTRPESSPLPGSGVQLLNVSQSSTLAILLNPQFIGPFMQSGTLAVKGLYEDRPLTISPNVGWADWGADNSTLYYTLTDQKGCTWIEAYSQDSHQTRRIYPSSASSDNQYTHIRVSPNGEMLAFEQRRGMDIGGEVVILRISGGTPTVSRYYGSLSGLAWPPNGKEVWFTAAEKGQLRSIYALRVHGGERVVYQVPDTLSIQDISKNGDVLVTRDFTTSDAVVRRLDQNSSDIDLSLFDWSQMGDISGDGKKVAIFENGDSIRKPSVFLREVGGGPATNLGEATAPIYFSPDGNSLLALSNDKCARVLLLSPEKQTQILTRANLCAYRAIWAPDGHHIVFDATEQGHNSRCFFQTIGGADARPFSVEGMHCPLVSPDGRFALAQNETELFKISIDASQTPVKVKVPLPNAGRIRPIRWLTDNKIVVNDGPMQELLTADLVTGKTNAIQVNLPTRFKSIFALKVSSDLKSIAYSGYSSTSELFLIRGLQ